MNHLPGLPLNHDPPDLSLPSNLDYRREPPMPGLPASDVEKSLHLKSI
jgi:hypothetical protein